MTIPMIDLREQLNTTAPEWRQHLDELFTKMHFVLGGQVASFERELAECLGARRSIGVGSGTDALELCLRSVGNRIGREVLTSALTSPFTAQAILAAGLTPRFADVLPGTLLMDPDDAAQRINARTGAIVAVHLYGQPCHLLRLSVLAKSRGVALIQDACQAHGARFLRLPLTHYSQWVAYSFYPTKNLGCLGDGGAVVTDSDATADQIRLLRDGGRRKDQVSRVQATNSRLDEIQACYLRAFLPRLDEWNARRVRLAALYDEALAGCEAVCPVRRSPESVCHLYVIRAKRRDRLRMHLLRQGIITNVHYPAPLHLHPAFRACGDKRGSLPYAEEACREIVSLPLWPHMPESAVLRVSERVREFYIRNYGAVQVKADARTATHP